MRLSGLLFLMVMCCWQGGIAQPVPLPGESALGGEDALEIQYFSVGCFKLRVGGTALLTDPFWTHIPAGKVLFGELRSDSTQIEPHLPRLDDIDGILVSHGHYDHILDLPYISPRLPASAPVLGSETARCILSPCSLAQEIRPVNGIVAGPDTAGEWVYLDGGRLRVLPIRGKHPNHLLFLHLWGKSLQVPLAEPPLRGKDFQEGLTLAWLIDFLEADGKGVRYRVFFQSSVAEYPYGFFPAEILREHQVDVALLGMGYADLELKGKRSAIGHLHPETVVFCHWENFFHPKTDAPKSGKLRRIRKKVDRLKLEGPPGIRYVVPEWDGKYYFPSTD